MAGFSRVMQYCDSLDAYEQAKSAGIVTDDIFVIILSDSVAKFKGKTFDWNGGGSLKE